MAISVTILIISVAMPNAISTSGQMVPGVGVDGVVGGVSATLVVGKGVGVFGKGVGVAA
jgi:hypothetical protein